MMLMCFQASTSPAKPADHQIQSSAKERIGFTSSPAIRAAAEGVSLLSRLVTQHKLAKGRDSRHEGISLMLCMECHAHCVGSMKSYALLSIGGED